MAKKVEVPKLTLLDRAIGYFAPGRALKRTVARRRLNRLESFKARTRSFDAISGNRMRYDFLAPKNSPDSAIKDGMESLRNHVRQLEYNNGFISGPIQRIVNNVVGMGFQFQARVKTDSDNGPFPKITQDVADLFNARIERLWKLWSRKSDKRLIQNFNEQLALAEATLLRDGEILIVGRDSKRRDRMISYCLDLLEIDRLSSPMSELINPKIRNGIEFDDEGVPKTYYVLKRHPGETITGLTRKGDDYEEIPAFNPNGTRKVLHLYNPLRPEQSRGFSAFASALKDFQDLDRYREAEIYAALEDACLTGIVKTQAPDLWQAARTVANVGEDDGDKTEKRIHEFAPGQWHYLNPGEEVDIHGPKRPNEAFEHMVNQLLRGPANALDIPPEVLSQNWQGMNYSNARTVLLMFYLSCRIRQKFLVDHLCVPVYENVLNQLVAVGKIQALGFDRRKDAFLSHAWIPPGWQWVDPVKEAKGKEIEIKNNFETLADLCASKGKDFEETLEQRARELRKIKDLEEEYEVTFPKPGPAKSGGSPNGEGFSEGEEPERPISLVM